VFKSRRRRPKPKSWKRVKMKAEDIIIRAFNKAGIRAAETPLTGTESTEGLASLNGILSQWGADRTLVGALPVADASQEVEIPEYAIRALEYAVALDIAPNYGKKIDPRTAARAQDAEDRMMKAGLDLAGADFPNTLPIGSGNSGYAGASLTKFFPTQTKKNFGS
jgi:hypothetical protein